MSRLLDPQHSANGALGKHSWAGGSGGRRLPCAVEAHAACCRPREKSQQGQGRANNGLDPPVMAATARCGLAVASNALSSQLEAAGAPGVAHSRSGASRLFGP